LQGGGEDNEEYIAVHIALCALFLFSAAVYGYGKQRSFKSLEPGIHACHPCAPVSLCSESGILFLTEQDRNFKGIRITMAKLLQDRDAA
jgi:hypothetical protein